MIIDNILGTNWIINIIIVTLEYYLIIRYIVSDRVDFLRDRSDISLRATEREHSWWLLWSHGST